MARSKFWYLIYIVHGHRCTLHVCRDTVLYNCVVTFLQAFHLSSLLNTACGGQIQLSQTLHTCTCVIVHTMYMHIYDLPTCGLPFVYQFQPLAKTFTNYDYMYSYTYINMWTLQAVNVYIRFTCTFCTRLCNFYLLKVCTKSFNHSQQAR